MLSEQINDSCQWFGKVDLKVKTAISSGMSLQHVNPVHRTYMRVECAQLVWFRMMHGTETGLHLAA